MGESDEREHIEIELVAGNSPDSPFAPPEHASATEGSAPGGGLDRRVIVVASIVAVMALALGWMLGRSAADDAASPALAVTSVVAPDVTEPVDTTAAAETLPPPTPVPPTTAAPSVAGSDDDASAPVTEPVEIAEAVLGQELEVVTYGNGQQLVRVDLETGTLVTQRVERPPFGRASLIVGDEWVMIPAPDPDLPTIVVDDAGTISEMPFGPTWQLAGTDDGTGLWVMSPELADGGSGTIERVPVSGGDAEQLALPGPPSRLDPSGGFVVDAPSGSFRVEADGVTQITTGELIAIGRDLALAEECDTSLDCEVVVIDRASGARNPIDVERPLDDRFLTSIAIIGGESVSPDGSLAMVWVVNPSDRSSGQAVLGTVDLETGAVVEVGPAQDIDQTVWSPDSRFLFHNRGGKIVAYEPGTGVSHVVVDDVIAVDAFAVRRSTGQ